MWIIIHVKICKKLLTLNKYTTIAGSNFQNVGLWLSQTGPWTNFKFPHKSEIYWTLSYCLWIHYSAEWGSS